MSLGRSLLCALLPAVLTGCVSAGGNQGSGAAGASMAADFAVAKSVAPAMAEAPAANQRFLVAEGRKMAFTASLNMSVDDPAAALEAARTLTGQAGGYVQEVNDYRVTLKIPVAKAEEVMAAIEKLGSVTSRRIVGEDLSEQVADLNIRLDNLEKLRARLAELLKRADKVEDMLKIEQELSRVTTDLERLTAQLRNATNRIEFVTLNVAFNQTAPMPRPAETVPIPWVAELGSTSGKCDYPMNGRDDLPFELELPDGFVAVYSSSSYGGPREFVAVSADDCVIKLSRRDDLKGGTLSFWSELIERALTRINNYVILENREFRNDEGIRGQLISAERTVGREKYRYQVLIFDFGRGFLTDNELYLVESWGPGKAFETHVPELEKAMESADLSIWR